MVLQSVSGPTFGACLIKILVRLLAVTTEVIVISFVFVLGLMN